MARVTGEEVKEIINTSLTEDECDPFISSANVIVNNRLNGTSATSTDKYHVELWLSAHLIYIREPGRKSEEIGDAKDEYHLPGVGKGLEATPYGQQVLLLDPTGEMQNLGKRQAKIETIYDSSS